MKLTEAQASLVRLLKSGMTPRCIHRVEAMRSGLLADFERARRAGMLVSAGYETSGAADEWLNSPEGRTALEEQDV